MEVVDEIRTIYDNYDFDTEIIVASIRTPLHVRDCGTHGRRYCDNTTSMYLTR